MQRLAGDIYCTGKKKDEKGKLVECGYHLMTAHPKNAYMYQKPNKENAVVPSGKCPVCGSIYDITFGEEQNVRIEQNRERVRKGRLDDNGDEIFEGVPDDVKSMKKDEIEALRKSNKKADVNKLSEKQIEELAKS